MGFCSSFFHFPCTLTWDFTAHAHKTGSWFPIFIANELVRSIQAMVICAKFGAGWTSRFLVIQVLIKFVISLAAILDFEKGHFKACQCMQCGNKKPCIKFCQNRTDDSEVIQVFVNFKIASPPSWIPLYLNFRPTALCSMTSLTQELKLMHLAWTVQKLRCFVHF